MVKGVEEVASMLRGLTCDSNNSHFLGGLIVEGCAQPAQSFPGVGQLDDRYAQRAAL